MALTEGARLQLEGKEFNVLFNAHEADWAAMAHKARKLMTEHVPHGNPTIDDIKKILLPMVEIDPRLLAHMVAQRATQKYYISHFTDYILHRVFNPTLPPPPPAA